MATVVLVSLILGSILVFALSRFFLVRYTQALSEWIHENTQGEPFGTLQEQEGRGRGYKLTPDDIRWLARAKSRRFRTGCIYAAGGACCALALTRAFQIEAGAHSNDALVAIFSINLWPVALSLSEIFRWTSKRWLVLCCIYLCIFECVAVLSSSHGRKTSVESLLVMFLLLNGIPTVAAKLISWGRIRRIGATILPLSIIIIAGSLAILEAFLLRPSLFDTRASDSFRRLAVIFLAGLVVTVILGVLLSQLLIALYQRHQISDRSLLIDSLWFLFLSFQGLLWLTVTGGEQAAGWTWMYIAVALYIVGVHLGLRVFQTKGGMGADRTSRLLVLRSFDLKTRAVRVFDAVSELWRYIGPVSLIGASDFASATIQPSTFLDFVSGKLRQLYIQSPTDLERRIHAINSPPDPDGRFRVYDVLCYANTWKPTVSRLLWENDVALADFRGISLGHRKGCEWEIQQAARVLGLNRCVFLLDGEADYKRLIDALHEAIGPYQESTVRFVDHTRAGNLAVEHLLTELFSALEEPRAQQTGSASVKI